MVNLIIPAKQSSRLPHKNSMLASYTLRWLAQEEQDLLDAGIEYRVIGVGCPEEIPDWVDIRVHTDCVSMQADIEQVEREYPADVSVLLQLTQPLRERGLLMRTLEQFRRNGKTIISATRMRDQRWRVIDCNGVWYAKDSVFAGQQDGFVLMHDGVIYAWGRGKAHEIFERTTAHDVVISSEVLPLVDVDYQEDLWRFRTTLI